MDWLRRRGERKAEQEAAAAEAQEAQAAADRAWEEEVVEDLGVVAFQRDGGIRVDIHGAAERKLAIKELRLKKKELTAQKRELSAEIAATRAEYRTKVAGRYSTRSLGRGTSGESSVPECRRSAVVSAWKWTTPSSPSNRNETRLTGE